MPLYKKILNILASFFIMLCIGGVYAWSIFATELIDKFQFTVSQTQIIFSAIIAVFPITMILVGRFMGLLKFRYLGYISGLLFFLGYYLAGKSQGSFFLILVGIGVLAGIATGFGYWLSLTLSVKSFPARKGLVTGIVTAGFGLGAVIMSKVSEVMLIKGSSILEVFTQFSVTYGLIIIAFSSLICFQHISPIIAKDAIRTRDFIKAAIFIKLVIGMFLGSFAGLFVIGSLKIIGAQSSIGDHHLNLAISVFAISNFLGRLFWGSISDVIGANLSIFLALLIQAFAISLLNVQNSWHLTFLFTAALIGVAFGGNFVLFAKETSQVFGVDNIGTIYPYVFIGYSIAGIASPMIGGFIFDISGSFFYSILIAISMSLAGSLLFLQQFIRERKAGIARKH